MSDIRVEELLARLYVDEALRARFLSDPEGVSGAAGLDPAAARALAGIDRAGLELAARSFARKRASARVKPRSIMGRFAARAFRG